MIILDAGLHGIGCALGCLQLMDIGVVQVKNKELPTLLDGALEIKAPPASQEVKMLTMSDLDGWPTINKPPKDWQHRRVNNWKSKRRRAR